MKSWFYGITIILIICGIVTRCSIPEVSSDVPVLYWVTDQRPGLDEQIEVFYEWLEKNGYPPMEVHIDAANAAMTKKLIQGVSGVAGEIIDCYRAKRDLLLFHGVGMLEDVTEEAERLGFGPDQTYPGMGEVIMIDGKQFAFPRNVATFQLWVNRDTFTELGLAKPPATWTWDEFERVGREFVARANVDENKPPVFFAIPDQTDPFSLPLILLRSTGMSIFNETMTASVLNEPRMIKVLETMHRWTFEEHLFPTAADRASFNTASGFGGSAIQLFREGQVGMIMMGRYALLQLRLFDEPLDLSISELPSNGFSNTLLLGGVSAVYAGAKHKDLATYFLAYLASEEYNMQIIWDADGLPPNPRFTETKAFLHPPDFPNEWGIHEAFSRAAKELAIPYDYNEFILPATVTRILTNHYDSFMNDLIDASTAARLMEEDLNAEIARSIRERPKFATVYADLLRTQAAIDRLKEQGAEIPEHLIRNPFHRAYRLRTESGKP